MKFDFTNIIKQIVMKKFLRFLKDYTNTVAYFIALLFVYAAFSKFLDFENFQVQLAQSPLLSAYAEFISFAVIIVELTLAFYLCLLPFQKLALYGSLGLMSAFTIYIYLILNYSDFVPCSCGGILEKLGWTEHLIFNIIIVILALTAILVKERKEKPQKKLTLPLLISLCTIIISCGIVVTLFLRSEHIIKQENNFTRRFLPHPIVPNKAYDLLVNSYYFAGSTSDKIFLGNYSSPLTFTIMDTALTSFKQIKIRLDNSEYNFKNLQLKIKSPYFYLFDGSIPVIYRGKLGDTIARQISYRNAYFNQLAIIDSASFIIRTQNSKNLQYTLGKLDLNKNPKVRLFPSILEKQIDGVFDVDGKLINDAPFLSFIYCYTYRNQFIVMDSSLNRTTKLNTIDTTKLAQISITKLSDGNRKMNAPPVKVNNNVFSYRHVLFVQSNLMGKHESPKAWKTSTAIDLYRTDKQEYIASFYLDNIKSKEGLQFFANDKYLYIILDKTLYKFQFRETITKHFSK